MITVYIDGVDRSSIIEFGTVKKRDVINQQTDTCDFDIIYHSGQTFRPEANSEVIVYNGATKIFGGKIYFINKKIESDNRVRYGVKVKDYSYDLDRTLVVEGYESMTVNAIIADILSNFTDGTFTDVNVDCDLTITKVTFDRVSVSDALQKLADLTGYSWYVDYDKDIHFFSKNTEPAPENITSDGDGNCIPSTLEISNDLSQIRNRVFIKGGEVEGNSRTESFDGDGSKLVFRLANKFSKLPTVTVGGVAKTVGLDFISNEDDFDCFWDYTQKYVRFKVSTVPPGGTDNVEIAGLPQYNLVVQVEDPISIGEYGVFEFSKTDKTLQSREEAVSYAKAQLEAYKNGVDEGSFQTYVDGFRSGQIIRITSALLNVDEEFLIQSVNFSMVTTGRYIYTVKLATLRTVKIIDFLIGLLKTGDRLIQETGETVLEKTVFPIENISMSESVEINTDDYPQTENIEMQEVATVQALDYPVEFVIGPYVPTGYKRIFIIGGGSKIAPNS